MTATFRQYIDWNKQHVLNYLENKGYRPTADILKNYAGEKDMYQVRKAIKELEKEGKVEFKIIGLNTKCWKLKN